MSQVLERPDARGERVAWRFVIAAIVVRVAFVLLYPQMPVCGDCLLYDEVGRNVAAGRGFLGGFAAETYARPLVHDPNALEVAVGPGYPAFLGGIYVVAGHSFTAVRILQACLSGLMLAPFYLLVRDVFEERQARLASILVAISPPLIFYTGFVLTESLTTVFLVTTMWAIVHASSRGTMRSWIMAGVLTGLSTLQRAELLVVGLAVSLVVVLFSRARPPSRMISVVAFLAATAATIAPWTVRNYVHFNRLIPVAALDGNTLWISVKGWEGWHFDDPELQALVRGRSFVEQNDVLRADALDLIRQSPGAYLRVRAVRFPDFWLTSHTMALRGLSETYAAYRNRGEQVRVMLKYALLAFNTILVGLGVVGMLWRMRWSQSLEVLLLATPIVSIAVVHFFLYASPRYQVPILPFLFAFIPYPPWQPRA